MKFNINSITACFCLQNPFQEDQLSDLLKKTAKFGVQNEGTLQKNEGVWFEQELSYIFNEKHWKSRFRQIYLHGQQHYSTFSLDLDSNFFLPENALSYVPDKDEKFLYYIKLVSEIIIGIKPLIGEIDFEADLICSDLAAGFHDPIASWGNFFSIDWINSLHSEIRNEIMSTVDDLYEIKDIGILTFIHPLTANRQWNSRHEKLNRIIRNYFHI